MGDEASAVHRRSLRAFGIRRTSRSRAIAVQDCRRSRAQQKRTAPVTVAPSKENGCPWLTRRSALIPADDCESKMTDPRTRAPQGDGCSLKSGTARYQIPVCFRSLCRIERPGDDRAATRTHFMALGGQFRAPAQQAGKRMQVGADLVVGACAGNGAFAIRQSRTNSPDAYFPQQTVLSLRCQILKLGQFSSGGPTLIAPPLPCPRPEAPWLGSLAVTGTPECRDRRGSRCDLGFSSACRLGRETRGEGFA